MWMRQASSTNLSTRRHPEQAQAFATRRPANEGSVHSHPANKIQPLSSRAKRGICSPQYQKTRVPHISRFSRCGCRQSPGSFSSYVFPTRLCRPPNSVIPSEVRDLLSAGTQQQPPFGKSVAQSGAPHLAVFEMWVRQAILSKRRPSQREGLPTKDPCTPPCR